MNKQSREISERNRDTRRARLANAALLEVFMARRKACVVEGFSLSEANEQAHGAVDEVVERQRLFGVTSDVATSAQTKLS